MADETMVEEVAPATMEETHDVNITAGDLSTMVKVIDAGSQRGAWRGEELATIGGLRDKLVKIVNAIAPVAAEEAAEEVVEDGDDAAEEVADAVVDAE